MATLGLLKVELNWLEQHNSNSELKPSCLVTALNAKWSLVYSKTSPGAKNMIVIELSSLVLKMC